MRSGLNSLNKLNNLKQRVITASIGAILIVSFIYFGPWYYFSLFFVLCMLTQLEFYKLVGLDGLVPLKTWGTLCGLLIFCLSFLVENDILTIYYYFFIFPVVSCIYFIKLYKRNEKKPFTNIAFTFLGICYVAIPFALLNYITFSQGYYTPQVILGCLLLLWASDTGAYFAGVRFGKRKLFERVSPKKSWEGSIGGTLFAIIVAIGLSYLFTALMAWQWLTISAIIVVAGTYGDLVESLFKRSIAIKDSGTAVPGHGGFLDRFDGLLLSAPFIVAFLKVF
ncbi:phosphatidate cytidylyltransferase [soil metagenome]